MKLLIMQFSPTSCLFIPLWSKYPSIIIIIIIIIRNVTPQSTVVAVYITYANADQSFPFPIEQL
jgi:hypothetical protein